MLGRLVAYASALIILTTGMANAACYEPRNQLPANVINNFLANPQDWLGRFPTGGGQMVSAVRDLLASDPATLAKIKELLKTANPSQLAAFGSGMGQASRVCIGRDQAFTTLIQQAVTESGSKEVQDAFAAVNPDSQTAAAGGGAGGGSGGGGPSGGGIPGGGGGGSGGGGSGTGGGGGHGGGGGLSGGGGGAGGGSGRGGSTNGPFSFR